MRHTSKDLSRQKDVFTTYTSLTISAFMIIVNITGGAYRLKWGLVAQFVTLVKLQMVSVLMNTYSLVFVSVVLTICLSFDISQNSTEGDFP